MGSKKHIIVLALVIVLSIIDVAFYLYAYRNGILWDLAVYRAAADNIKNNINPYSIGQGHLFIYHPIVLDLFTLLAKINLDFVLGSFYLISILFLLLSLEFKYSKILLSISFGGLGITSFATGNVTPFLHLFLLALLLKEERNDSFFLSYIVIIIFSLIKPYFLAYLLVPLLVYQENTKNKIGVCLISIAIYVAVVTLYQVANPAIVGNFFTSLYYQTLTKNDIGYSFFYWAFQLTHSGIISLIIHSILSITLIILLFLFRFRWFGKLISGETALYLTYFVLTIINPRMKEYDLFPALLSLFLFGKNVLGEKFLEYYLASLIVVSFPLVVEIAKKLWDLSPSYYLTYNWLWQWGSILVFLGAIFLNTRFIRLRLSKLSSP